MQGRIIYIVTHHATPKRRAGGVYYNSDKDLTNHMNATRLYYDVGQVVYKVECASEGEEYRILEALRNGEKVNLLGYKNVTAAVYFLNKQPSFRPLIEYLENIGDKNFPNVFPNANRIFKQTPSSGPQPQNFKKINHKKILDDNVREAMQGNAEKARYVLNKYSGQLLPDVLCAIIVANRTDPELFNSIDALLGKIGLSLYNFAMRDPQLAISLLSNRLVAKFTSFQIAEIAERHPRAYKQANFENKLDQRATFSHLYSDWEARKKIDDSPILRDLFEVKAQKEADKPNESEKEKEPPERRQSKFDETVLADIKQAKGKSSKDLMALITFLSSDPKFKNDSNFLRDIDTILMKLGTSFFKMAFDDPEIAIKMLNIRYDKSSRHVLADYFTPLELAKITHQHRYDKSYKEAVLTSQLEPCASPARIFSENNLQKNPELGQIYKLSGGVQQLVIQERIEIEKAEKNRQRAQSAHFIDLYQVLNLNRNATSSDIKKTYHTLARKYHPDAGLSVMGDRFKEIKDAYEILSDPVKRVAYDEQYDKQFANKESHHLGPGQR